MSWTLARYQVTSSSCECSYVIYGACYIIYLLVRSISISIFVSLIPLFVFGR